MLLIQSMLITNCGLNRGQMASKIQLRTLDNEAFELPNVLALPRGRS
jgi:hypothetical protein